MTFQDPGQKGSYSQSTYPTAFPTKPLTHSTSYSTSETHSPSCNLALDMLISNELQFDVDMFF